MRINKFLADKGIASRRHADEIIAAGRVTINGVVARGRRSCVGWNCP